jgi:hypothetical protein
MALQDDLDVLFGPGAPVSAKPVAASTAGQVADMFTSLPAIKERIATAQTQADNATDAMVANAPKYAEISQSRTAFAEQTQTPIRRSATPSSKMRLSCSSSRRQFSSA